MVHGALGRSRSCGRPRHSNIQSLNEFSIEKRWLMRYHDRVMRGPRAREE